MTEVQIRTIKETAKSTVIVLYIEKRTYYIRFPLDVKSSIFEAVIRVLRQIEDDIKFIIDTSYGVSSIAKDIKRDKWPKKLLKYSNIYGRLVTGRDVELTFKPLSPVDKEFAQKRAVDVTPIFKKSRSEEAQQKLF